MQQSSEIIARLRDSMAGAGMPYTGKNPLKTDGTANRWHENGKANGSRWAFVHVLSSGHIAASFGDWRTGQSHRFRSWEGNGVDHEEVKRLDDEWERRQAAAEENAAKTRAISIKQALSQWELMPETGNSAYLERKQVKAFGIKYGADYRGPFVAVPMRFVSGEFRGYQRIYADGYKPYASGCSQKKAYHLIGQLEPGGILYLVEGYATGATAHEATGKPVAMCFDAHNLKAVADALKAIYPELQIVIAADNDQWKAEKLDKSGKKVGNTGVKAAFDVARACPGTRIAIPDFSNLDTSSEPTDYNDLAALTNLENVACQLDRAFEPKTNIPQSKEPIDFILTEQGNPRALDENVREVLTKDEAWNGIFGFDEFGNRVVLLKRPPYDSQQGEWRQRMLSDTDATKAAQWMQRKYELPVSPRMVHESIIAHAMDFKFHPVKTYLESLKWDGTPRLDAWLIKHLGADDTSYVRAVARKTLISAVARVLYPGCKVDTCTILEGEQGLLKSTTWRVLASDKWFSDSLPSDLGAKDAMSHLADCWIVELAELSSMKRSELDATKRFLSAVQDKYRPSYGRNDIIQPRQCIFVGTTNEERYLKDPTGNRRFWPIKVTRRCNIDALAADRDQLWAEAVACYKSGERWYMTHEEEAMASIEQDDRLEVDDWEQPITEWLNTRQQLTFVTGKELALDALGFEAERDISQVVTKRIAGIMRKLGWGKGKTRTGGVQVKGYAKTTGTKTTKQVPSGTINPNKINDGTCGTCGTCSNAYREVENDNRSEKDNISTLYNLKETVVPPVPPVPHTETGSHPELASGQPTHTGSSDDVLLDFGVDSPPPQTPAAEPAPQPDPSAPQVETKQPAPKRPSSWNGPCAKCGNVCEIATGGLWCGVVGQRLPKGASSVGTQCQSYRPRGNAAITRIDVVPVSAAGQEVRQ